MLRECLNSVDRFAGKMVSEEFYLLGYNSMPDESQPTFRRNMSPPFLESKNRPSKKSA
jgi:hypothetical protein